MAGSRMNYSNVQTNTRGSVRASAQVALGGTAANPTVVSGPGMAVVAASSTVITVQFPERYAANRIHDLQLTFISATTLAPFSAPLLVTGYTVPTTGASFCQFSIFNVTTAAAVAAPIGTVYVSLEASLGM